MVRKTLIDRIDEIRNLEDVNSSVFKALSVQYIDPKGRWKSMPYLKYNLTDEIASLIGDRTFSDNLYSAVNKNVLKRVYYGILSTGDLPSEFLEKLTNWEKVYFFRGRWSGRRPNLSDPLLVLTSKHIHLGLNKLHEDHYVRKAKNIYKSEKKFPESDFVRRDYGEIIEIFSRQTENLGPKTEKRSDPVQLNIFR